MEEEGKDIADIGQEPLAEVIARTLATEGKAVPDWLRSKTGYRQKVFHIAPTSSDDWITNAEDVPLDDLENQRAFFELNNI